jgi:hypothetical protein
MPLQIRRGTDAERIAMTTPLAEGELLWVTDDSKLYIGRKSLAPPYALISSAALTPVTGFNAEDAQDAAASLFTTTPTHSGISFAYDDFAGKLTATVDLSDYTGTLKASSFKGTFVADDSSILVDGVAGVLKGTLVGSLTGNVTGNVTGNLSGNVTGNVTGNTAGYHTGDVKGSVFADNSSILVDAVDGIFFGTVDTGDIRITTDTITSNNLFVGSTTTPLNALQIHSDFFTYRTLADTVNGKFFTLAQSRGTLASPTAIQAGDELGGFLVRAYTSSSVSAVAGAFGFVVDSTAVISGGGFVKSKAVIAASTDTSQDLANALVVDSAGVVSANAFSATKYFKLPVYANDAARTSAIPTPAAGMMVFMTSGTSPAVTNKTVVYDSTAWVALH